LYIYIYIYLISKYFHTNMCLFSIHLNKISNIYLKQWTIVIWVYYIYLYGILKYYLSIYCQHLIVYFLVLFVHQMWVHLLIILHYSMNLVLTQIIHNCLLLMEYYTLYFVSHIYFYPISQFLVIFQLLIYNIIYIIYDV